VAGITPDAVGAGVSAILYVLAVIVLIVIVLRLLGIWV
jgi:hypothetical protein